MVIKDGGERGTQITGQDGPQSSGNYRQLITPVCCWHSEVRQIPPVRVLAGGVQGSLMGKDFEDTERRAK